MLGHHWFTLSDALVKDSRIWVRCTYSAVDSAHGLSIVLFMERDAGIEPAISVWKTDVIPFN